MAKKTTKVKENVADVNLNKDLAKHLYNHSNGNEVVVKIGESVHKCSHLEFQTTLANASEEDTEEVVGLLKQHAQGKVWLKHHKA